MRMRVSLSLLWAFCLSTLFVDILPIDILFVDILLSTFCFRHFACQHFDTSPIFHRFIAFKLIVYIDYYMAIVHNEFHQFRFVDQEVSGLYDCIHYGSLNNIT
jgi:hypothetical protein